MNHELWLGISGRKEDATLRFVGWVHEIAPDGKPLCDAQPTHRHIKRIPTEDDLTCTRCETIRKNPLRYALARRRRNR